MDSRLYTKESDIYSDLEQDRVVCKDCDWWIHADADVDFDTIHSDDVCPGDREFKRELLNYLEEVEDASLEDIGREFREESIWRVVEALDEIHYAGSIYEPERGRIETVSD